MHKHIHICACVHAYVETFRRKHKNRAVGRSRRGPLWQKNAEDKIAQPLHRRNPSLRVVQSPHCSLAKLCQCTRVFYVAKPKAKAKLTLGCQLPINTYMCIQRSHVSFLVPSSDLFSSRFLVVPISYPFSLSRDPTFSHFHLSLFRFLLFCPCRVSSLLFLKLIPYGKYVTV